MSLQFVLGGSGSGKSTYVYDRIIERSMEEDKLFFVLVPDQFTMQTQMEFVNRHPRGGILNIDILSFSRLSYKINEETGGGKETVLDDTGKSLVLRKVAQELKDELPVLGSNLKKIGYIHEVKSAISEFMEYGIDQKKMESMLEYSKNRGGLHGKLKDLGTLYQGFTNYIGEKYVTTEETYERLAANLDKSKIIKNSVIVMDGFTGFTPIQLKVIRKLMMYADELIMTVTMDPREVGQDAKMQQIFSLSHKTIRDVTKIAGEEKIECNPWIWMEREKKRFLQAPDLAHLEDNLFRYPYQIREEKADGIRIFEAATIEDEVKNTCKQIRRLLQEGYCYRDIAVIVSDLETYASQVEETFDEYEIPIFLDQTKKITLNPFVEYLRATIQILVKNYSYEAMFHYLRSGMVEYDRDLIDKLENYCLATGVKGKKAWSTLFCSFVGAKGKDYTEKEKKEQEKELEELNNTRNQIVESLSVFKSGKQTVREQVLQLYKFIENNQCMGKLETYRNEFSMAGDYAKEKEYAQIYRLIMELLNQIVSLLGDEVLTWEEFGQILDAGFGEIQVGMIPKSVDQIVVGDMERTRLKQVKALFFLGVNDGKIPKQSVSGGMLSDIDREFLAQGEFELAPTPRQQLFIQKFYLYLNVTKPSHKLYLSYANVGKDGKLLKPSYFIGGIRKLFSKITVEKTEDFLDRECLTREEGRIQAARMLDRYKRGTLKDGEEDKLVALLKVLKEEADGKTWVDDLLDSVFYSYEGAKLSREAAKLLYGTVLHSSVSRLEKMASCAYAHYLQYGLGLREREEYSFEAVDMGNVFHGVLEIFAGKLANDGYTWTDFPPEEGKELLRSSLESYAINYGNTVLFATARNAYVKDKIEAILLRTIETMQYQLQKGKFLPQHYEISFSSLADLDAVSVQLNENEKMYLQGRIDRVDTYEKEQNLYVKVMDYKSSKQEFQLAAFYHGLQLQLVVYLNAAMELKKKQNPGKNVLPGAFVYYHVFDPLVDAKEGASQEDIDKEIKKQLRVSGIVSNRQEVLDGLDYEKEGASDVIEVEYKKDGTLGSRSHVMSTEQIETLQAYAAKKIAALGNEIADGNIAISPTTFKNKESCTYCAYKEICAFEPGLPGFQKRECKSMDTEESWSLIREALEDKKPETEESRP